MTPARLLSLSDVYKRRIGNGIPTILLACGSFSPITYLHLRLFEQARDYLRQHRPDLEVVAGVISPVHDEYGKRFLVPSSDRLAMCRLAVHSSDWLMVDEWEAKQRKWSRTREVLQHIETEANRDRPSTRVQVMLLAGGDLVHSFNTPNLWLDEDLRVILKDHNVVVIERIGTDLASVIQQSSILQQYQSGIIVVPQHIANDVSSTKVREAIQRDHSIRYLLPDQVAQYIYDHGLFRDK